MLVHVVGVRSVIEMSNGCAGLWTNGAQEITIIIPMVMHDWGTTPKSGPNPTEHTFLSNAGFILKINVDMAQINAIG